MILINPTGGNIRSDSMGCGLYGAPRGDRKHNGLDYCCDPGQTVVSPIDGKIIRVALPYAGAKYTGLMIEGHQITITMFYISPLPYIVGKDVKAGDVVAIAQDISEKYGHGMLPHVHLRIDSIDPLLVMEK